MEREKKDTMKLGGMMMCELSDMLSSKDGIVGRCHVLRSITQKKDKIGVDFLNQVREVIDDYKNLSGNDCGGSLHVVLDDFNFEDKDIEFCMSYSFENNDQAGYALCQLLMVLSVEDRIMIIKGE